MGLRLQTPVLPPCACNCNTASAAKPFGPNSNREGADSFPLPWLMLRQRSHHHFPATALASEWAALAQVLSLSPEVTSVLSTAGTVKAALAGDLAGYSAAPDFEYSLLMIPDWTREPP